ncbi:hypothetical protein LINPERHAP1_LOCUS27350 [Linum perenne]
MSKNWGIPSEAKICCLEDDLWLVECPSKLVVDRIISLNRCFYGSSRLFLDRWTIEAGRSAVMEKQRLPWVLIQGIPLHLRSFDLFRAIGERCGGFIDFDDRLCPLNSVRIKIEVSKSIPKEVQLCFRKSVVTVKVWKESGGVVLVSKEVSSFVNRAGDRVENQEIRLDWRSCLLRGKAKLMEVGESSSSGVEHSLLDASGVKDVECVGSSGVREVTVDPKEGGGRKGGESHGIGDGGGGVGFTTRKRINSHGKLVTGSISHDY